MQTAYGYTMLIAALAILCALFEGMIPEGNLKRIVLLAIGLLFLTGLVTPLVDAVGGTVELQMPAASSPPASTDQITHEELLRNYMELEFEE